MAVGSCPKCGTLVFSANFFRCQTCWLEKVKPFGQLIYLLKLRAEDRLNPLTGCARGCRHDPWASETDPCYKCRSCDGYNTAQADSL